MTTSRQVLTALVLLALASCGSGEDTPEVFTWGDGTAEASRPEVFQWNHCAVELSPPPAEWKRQRSQGNVEGVRFQLARVPPGSIEVGYYRLLHRSHTVQSLASGVELSFEPPASGFTLADVVDRVRFDPGSLPGSGGVQVQPEVERSVDGLSALGLDYTWTDRGHTLHCREVYVVADEELFVAKVQGVEADLELFEWIVGAMRFHPDYSTVE